MMRGVALTISALALGGAAAFATGEMTVFPQPVQNALTVIDSVPTKAQLENVWPNGEGMTVLSGIALDAKADIGIRLRAIHALPKLCPQPCSTSELAHQSLETVISNTRISNTGSDVVLLRAAIETLGTLQVDSDVSLLIPLLDHPSRDIRAATARALRDLCNTQAITPLRVRYTSESTEQVKLAISEALRILGQCPTPP
jgi:hypothetical protein